MFIFLTSFTADSSYAACAEPYKYSCLIGGITLCSKVSTCDNYLITQAGDASCKEKGHAYFDSIQAGLSDQTVCKMYCAGLTPQSCPADYTAFTEPDYASNICRTVCVKTSSCTGSVQCESTEPILCQNGYKPATLSCEGRSFVTCKNTTCGAPGKFSCTLSKVEATPSISGGACSAGQYCVKFSVSYSGYPNRGTKNQHWNFGNGTGDNNSTYTTFRGYNYGSGSKSVTLEAWENGGSGNYASCPITVSVPSSDGTAPTATRTPTRTPTNTPIPGGGGGTAPTATRTPTNTPIPDGGGGGGGDDTYPPILYLDIRLFNDANNNGSKDIGEKNNTGAGTITTSTSMSPNCSGSGTRSYSFNKGGVSLGPGDSLTNDPMCVYVQSFDGPVIHDNPRMVTPSASASDYWFGVYISEVPTSTPTPTVPAGTTYNITGTVYVDNDPEGPGLCTSSTPVGDLSVLSQEVPDQSK